ncbi:MAG: hypothetical protein J6Y67_03680 [Lachnospiraceae bacterium]|nr:hypothetical protein [Lachnospiraceae bacterium]
MSRIRKDYEQSFAHRFLVFVKGDKPLPEEDHVEEWKTRVAEVKETERTANTNYIELKETDPDEEAKRMARISGMRIFRRIYYVLAVLMCLMIIGMLIMNVAYMPPFGSEDSPTNNEVAERYLSRGSEETGVVNTVTGMILQYRAFDTFGETNVLFVAACSVMILLFMKTEPEAEERKKKRKAETETAVAAEAPSCVWPQGGVTEEQEPEPDIILQNVARVVVPMIFLFGLYILLNGHLSPGGGFSGGAVIGAGLILYNAAFGFRKTRRFFDEKVYDIIKVGSLCLYALIIAYYLFTGANGIASAVPLGKLGAIISSGLILPINLLVGLEVACTMYAFYALFRRGTF